MTTILWRPEVNALTTPQSYRPLHIPRAVFGYDELAARIAAKNPVYNEGLGKSYMLAMREEIKELLAEGNQVTLEGLLTAHISLSGRLDAPDSPLPPAEESVHVSIYASKRLNDEVQQEGHLERLPVTKKAPVISAAEDTVLKLADVLNPNGLLRLSGADLLFDPQDEGCQCLIEGTAGGSTVQNRFGTIRNSEVMVIPDIPSQPEPWNNEYQVSISTRYSEHGTLRTGSARRPLRTPLLLSQFSDPNPPEVGILTGSAASPYISITGGALSGPGAWLRIQAVLNAQDGKLRLSLLDMTENGASGDAVRVNSNGDYTLQGFAGSPLSSLNLRVNDAAALTQLVRNSYSGWLVDVLEVRAGS